jgi:hypothetical protein
MNAGEPQVAIDDHQYPEWSERDLCELTAHETGLWSSTLYCGCSVSLSQRYFFRTQSAPFVKGRESEMLTLAGSDLRSKLDVGIFPNEHAGIIEDLRRFHMHGVRRAEPQPPLPQEDNCLSAALGIPPYDNGQFTDARFAHWMIHERKLAPLPELDAGALVFYFERERWQHAGTVTPEGKILSKWGAFMFFVHPWNEVPRSYGDQMEVYKHPGQEGAQKLFQQYVAECAALPEWAVSR